MRAFYLHWVAEFGRPPADGSEERSFRAAKAGWEAGESIAEAVEQAGEAHGYWVVNGIVAALEEAGVDPGDLLRLRRPPAPEGPRGALVVVPSSADEVPGLGVCRGCGGNFSRALARGLCEECQDDGGAP